jgi:hypothetical protein
VGAENCYLSFRSYSTDLANTSFTNDVSLDNSGAKIITLDSYFAEKHEQNISFIKADIEGFEWAMLHGAEEIIKRCKPKLAICVYHSIFDLFRIPLYLKKIVPEYKLEIRHHTDLDEETVVYCYV